VGEVRRLTFVVPPSRLAFYDPDMRFVVEPGSFAVSVGSSSVDIKVSRSFTLAGEVTAYRQCEVAPVKVV
jgi:beta-glucosidase